MSISRRFLSMLLVGVATNWHATFQAPGEAWNISAY